MTTAAAYFEAAWPAPPQVRTAITLRHPGVSEGVYASNNLALHVGDDPARVRDNRSQLAQSLGLAHWQWLEQVHGTAVIEAGGNATPKADGAFTRSPGEACVVLTADCLPVLLCDRQGRQVAAVHAGWRGLTHGILARAVETFEARAAEVMAYLGPAISQAHYEIDTLVTDELARLWPDNSWQSALEPVQAKPSHFRLDLYLLARIALGHAGVSAVYGGENCTFAGTDRFYSYRRDGATGRFASVIWLQP